MKICFHTQIWNRGAILEQKSRGILVKKLTTFQDQKGLLHRQIITEFYAKPACHTSIGVSASWGPKSY